MTGMSSTLTIMSPFAPVTNVSLLSFEPGSMPKTMTP